MRETASSLTTTITANNITKMEDASELEESLAESDTDSGSDCDFQNRNRASKRKIVK